MLKVTYVEALSNHRLKIELSNGKTGIFDVTPYLSKGIFVELKDESYFSHVTLKFNGIAWPNEQDFSADTIEASLQIDIAA